MTLTLSPGGPGEGLCLNVDWADHNNVTRRTVVGVRVQGQDKPRTLEVLVNGANLAQVTCYDAPEVRPAELR